MIRDIALLIDGYLERQKNPQPSFFDCSQNNNSDTLDIFVHGYSAMKDKDEVKAMMTKIASIKDGNHWLFVWPSGFLADVFLNDLQTTFKTIVGSLKSNTTFATILPLLGIKGLELVGHFKQNEKRAETFGANDFFVLLKQELDKSNRKFKKINIIGHSLGARLLFHAMKNAHLHPEIKINHMVCLGGAVCKTEKDWATIVDRLEGKLQNYYSLNDTALAIKPDLEKCIGRHPIELSKPNAKLLNHKVEYTHLEYWLHIDEIFKDIDLS
jgi:hypothetical protein